MPPRFKPEFPAPVSGKEQLRQRMRDTLRALSGNQRAEASLVICAQAANLEEFSRAGTVALFAPLPSEPDIHPLIEEAWAQRKRVVLPFLVKEVGRPEMHWHQVTSWDEIVVPGPFGLREPDPARCAQVKVGEIECAFVPGVACDDQGYRLGRGGGFYDRFLSEAGTLPAIGLCFATQRVPRVPREAHDQRLGMIVTEDGVTRF